MTLAHRLPVCRARARRISAATLVAVLTLQPLATLAVNLADVPLQRMNPVKPNLMFTLDDSGSMAGEYLPDYAGEGLASIYYCRDDADCSSGSVPSLAQPPIRSSNFNKLFYNPASEYLAGKKADASDLPYESASPGTWTQVYTNPFTGYPSASTSTTINLTNGYPDTLWCTVNTPTAAQRATADNPSDGSVCRRNGRAYTGTRPIAAGYNYPNDTGASGSTVKYNDGTTVYGAPYYYTISKVQFCQNRDTGSTHNAGFGKPPCVDRWDSVTYKYVRYGTSATQALDPTAFTRVDIVPTTPTYPSGRSYAAEMTNFARWYAFDRTRLLAMKTAGGIAFSALDGNSRVGFHVLNAFASGFLNLKDFTPANKAAWFEKFYNATASGVTPSLDATWRIGEYFSNNGAAAGLTGAVDPLDPVTGKCQSNYHLLSTDGYWNQTVVARPGIGNQDLTVPATLPGPIPGFTPGANFPYPYREGSGALSTSNTLADIAMYYWIRDIRGDKTNGVKDPIAPWQHVTLYGLSIGAEGSIPHPSGLPNVTAGTTQWPKPTSQTPAAIDDLWHATLNSRGEYFNAQSPEELATSLVEALTRINAPSGTASGVGIANAQLSTTDKYGYLTRFESGWWGDIKKYALDPDTGALPVDAAGNPLAPPLWSAAPQIDAQGAVTGSGPTLVKGWDVNRRIVTINDATGGAVPFRVANLSPAQQAALTTGWSIPPLPTASAVLDYLRGDPSNEGLLSGKFRKRYGHVLGDIVYSSAVPVGAPNAPYEDAGNPGYASFKATYASRTPQVYVGANGGMLHVLDDTVANGGKETWAYVPKAVFRSEDLVLARTEGIGALAYRNGGIPLFSHKFYVNATPRLWDVDFANTNTSSPPSSGNDWRTILVGGLGKGGRAVYALDATVPVSFTTTEASIAAAKKVLWEFTDSDLGYVYDAPTIVKTYRYGWVVLVASGYNTAGTRGILYVLNPKTGAVLKKLYTPAGSATAPNGLTTIRAYTGSRKDPYVFQAYGGDLNGNVWRFDLADSDDSKWKIEHIAKLTDGGGEPQPITSGVRIEIDQNNGYDRYLFIGTGKLLDQADLTDTSVLNTFYVIRDGSRTNPGVAPATPYSRADLNSVNGSLVAGFSGPSTGRGWYQDAPDATSKISADVYADVQVAVYAFLKPSSDPCESVLQGKLFARDLGTGNSVIQASTGTIVASIDILGGIAGVNLVQGKKDDVDPTKIGDVRVQVTTMDGKIQSFRANVSSSSGNKHRVSWRLLGSD